MKNKENNKTNKSPRRIDIKAILKNPKQRAKLLDLMAKFIIEIGKL